MDHKIMELEHVKGNTYVLKSWLCVPLYKVSETTCILLDTALPAQRGDLQRILDEHGLTCVGVINSHAHLDHAGNNRYFQEEYGAEIAMSLGEAGVQASVMGLCLHALNSPGQLAQDSRLAGTECVADRIIMPQEETVTVAGVTFDIIHTPGHSLDHICVRTPDNVLYLGDAMMAGPELFKAKFPYVLSINDYFESMCRLRETPADFYIAAHFGVYNEIRPFADMAIRHLAQRMMEILDLVTEPMILGQVTSQICRAYQAKAPSVMDLTYYYRATRAFLFYLLDRGELESFIQDNQIYYRRSQAAIERAARPMDLLPRTGIFR